MKSDSPWTAWRAELELPPGLVNFNAGSCSPCPRPVADELAELTRAISRDPVDMLWRVAPARIEGGRRALAAFLGIEPVDLLLFNNASYGVNTVLKSIAFEQGDELLTTDQEYDQYHPLLYHLEKDSGVRVVRAPLPPSDLDPNLSTAKIVHAFERSLSARTKLLFFSHVTSATGTVVPAKELVAMARARGIPSCVDGAHAPGLIDVDLAAVDADFYAANVHKWLMGPAGSAFLHVRRDSRALIKPLMTMGGFDYAAADADRPVHPDGPTRWAHSHEYQGTRNIAPFMVLDKVVRLCRDRDAAGARQRMTMLAGLARTTLRDAGLTVVSPTHHELATPLIACRIPTANGGIDKNKAWGALRRDHQVETAFPKLGDGTLLFRICTAWFNTEDEIAWLGKLLRQLDWNKWR